MIVARVEEVPGADFDVKPRVHLRCDDYSFMAINWKWKNFPKLGRKYRFFTIGSPFADQSIEYMLSDQEPIILNEDEAPRQTTIMEIIQTLATIAADPKAIVTFAGSTWEFQNDDPETGNQRLDVRIEVCNLHTLRSQEGPEVR